MKISKPNSTQCGKAIIETYNSNLKVFFTVELINIIKMFSIGVYLHRITNLAKNDPNDTYKVGNVYYHKEKFENLEHVPDVEQKVDVVLIQVQVLQE